MDGISRSGGRDKEIPHGVLPMEQLVLSDKWARKFYLKILCKKISHSSILCENFSPPDENFSYN